MDPFSFATSVLTVLELTGILVKYINDVRNAPKERAQIAQEVSNVYALLTTLRFRAEDVQNNDPWFNQVQLLAVKNGPLDQYKSTLEQLLVKVESASKIKDLLWKFNKTEIKEALEKIERLKSLINLALANDLFTLTQSLKNDVSEVVQDLEAIRLENESEWPSKLAAWLDVPDPSSNYATACKRRQEGTGSWLLQDDRFVNWKTSSGSSLWLHGIPGCGKTILTATIIDQIRSTPDASVVYFYFDFNDDDKRKVGKCVRSMIVQLARQVPSGIQEARKLYNKCHDGQLRPQEAALQTLLSHLIQRQTSSYIVFDALDECDDYQELLDVIESLIQRHENCLHFLATSRRERELEERLQPLITADIPIQTAAVDADINLYVEDLLKNDTRLRKWPLDVRNEIRETIAAKSSGMFRWAFCQIESLRKCIKLSALRQMLSSLPKTLDETYERILSTIEANNQLDDAVRILQWLCFAKRPQSLKELVEVLATSVEGNGGFMVEERLPDPLDIITICSSLITIKEEVVSEDIHVALHDPEDPVIQLAHFSVQEYLLSDRCTIKEHFSPDVGNAILAEISLIYTLHVCQESMDTDSNHIGLPSDPVVPISLGRSIRRQEDKTLSQVYDQYPLCKYACAWWYKHAVEVTEAHLPRRFLEMTVDLFEGRNNVLGWWLKFHNPNPFSWSKGRPRSAYFTGFRKPWGSRGEKEAKQSRLASPIFYATATGLSQVVTLLIERGNDVNQNNDIYPTPLHLAVLNRDLKMANVILNGGGDVNQHHAKAGSPLQTASASGNTADLVIRLLASGARLSEKPSGFTFLSPYTGYLTEMEGTVLQGAAYGGSVEVLKKLLEAGEEVPGPVTPMSIFRAIEEGFEHAEIKELSPDPLHSATKSSGVAVSPTRETKEFSRDHAEILRILISYGLDIHQGLWRAYDPADLGFFYALLDAGLSPNIRDEFGDTLLHRALHDNQPKVFNDLLKHGADLTAIDSWGRSCVDYAAPFLSSLRDFHIPTAHVEKANIYGRKDELHSSMQKNMGNILAGHQSLDITYHGLRHLGHCLAYLGWTEDATSILQMTIVQGRYPDTGFKHRVLCDGCQKDSPKTTLYVCRICRDVDLCDSCYRSYQKIDLGYIHLCQGHEFLEVPLSPFDEKYAQIGTAMTPKMIDWLVDLQARLPGNPPQEAVPILPPKVAATQIDIEVFVDSDEFGDTLDQIQET